jgi:predicted O-methyltransferase YrrM
LSVRPNTRQAARQAAGEFFAVPRSHPGGTIFILGGGPSLAGQPLDRIAGRPTIVVNLSYSVAPAATYVYAQDGRFVRRHLDILKRRFAGRFITVSRKEAWPGLLVCRKVEPSDGLPARNTDLAARRTSLAGAISIAVHMTGPGGTIVLLGADGGRAPDGRSHHHAAHPWPVKDENFAGQLADLTFLKPDLEAAGITVINCSPGSHWKGLWPIMSLNEFLNSEGKGMSAMSWTREEKRAKYFEAFQAEAARAYPQIDRFIELLGGDQLAGGASFKATWPFLQMAKVLACPMKERAPNWQHGRVLYSLARKVGELWRDAEAVTLVDIGTAKGFSALCMAWGLSDAGARGVVHSFDVIDPLERVERNTVAELDGLKNVPELVEPFMPAGKAVSVEFHRVPGMLFDQAVTVERIPLAFIDGKHKATDVFSEAGKIADRQRAGDFILFDDWQIPGVRDGILRFMQTGFGECYRYTSIDAIVGERAYRLAERAA